MRFSLQKLALAAALLLVNIQPASAQNYPLPGKQGQAPVVCTGCENRNTLGQDNDGLKTWPYGAPLTNHTGRFLDANFIANFQNPPRTLRARRIRIARQQRGAAPPRAYIQLGSAIGVYSLDRFFTTTLPSGMVPVTTLASSAKRPGYTPEKVARWDAQVSPETSTAWDTPTADGQDRLFDFDADDRGYVYIAAGLFGWAIVKDKGETNGNQLELVSQTLTDLPYCSVPSQPGTCAPAIDDPRMIVAIRAGSRYYTLVSDDTSRKGRRVWDVTDPAAPASASLKMGQQYAFIGWAKDDARSRTALVNGSKKIEIYDNSSLANGGSPLVTFSARSGRTYRDVTVDENGNFWTTEAGTALGSNNIVKFERSSSGYTERSFDVYGGAFTPESSQTTGFNTIEYGDKYLAVVGHTTGWSLDVRLFKVESGEPVAVELNSFFKNYYWTSPQDYAKPTGCEISYGTYPVKWGNKVYLLQSTNGIGDVFELAAGDSIATSQRSGTFGTTNPYAKSTESGPFYGDILKFRAESSNPLVSYNLTWNFGNPESGAANDTNSQTGQDVEHQFTGLNTAAKINEARQVRATATSNSEMTDSISVTMKLPTARIGVAGTTTALTVDGGSLDLVAGESLTDASDGSVESHYSAWTVDGVPSKKKPDQTISVEDVGPHTATLAATYGKYDGSFNTVGSPYVDTVSAISYTVRPFIAAFGTPSTTSTSITFKGSARKTSLTSILSAVTWTVDWSLKTSSGADIVPPSSSTVAVGQVPNFVISDKSLITSGSILRLKISVDPTGLIPAAAAYASHELTQTLITPDPKITKTGCANANDPCTFTASSVLGNSIADWNIVWTLKKSGVQVGGTFTGNPFKPSITLAGNYSVSAVATTSVFSGTAALPDFNVAAPVCSNPPTELQMSIWSSCVGGCDTNEDVILRGDPWQYIPEDCEEYIWNYGDGQSGTTTSRQTTHRYSTKGNKNVTLTVRKGTQTSPLFKLTINVGGTTNPPVDPPVCTAPANINFTYSGTKGCSTGTNCKVGEKITFTPLRGTAALLNCDTTTWTYHDESTSTLRTPSKTYSSTGTYSVELIVSNASGTSTPSIRNIVIVPDETQSSCVTPNTANIIATFRGRQTSCIGGANPRCAANEVIDFKAALYPLDNPQSCDRFEWNFGDSSANVTAKETSHAFASNGTYNVTLKWYNTTNPTGVTVPVTVVVGNSVEVKPVPQLSFASFPGAAAKGTPVTFTVNSNINATGWSWDFGDGQTDLTQSGVIGTSSTIQHSYANTGTYNVTVRARNAEDVASAAKGQALGTGLVVSDTPEFKYLLPVVTHAAGQNGSVWRTDVQIYSSDPSISPTNPLRMNAMLRDIPATLEVRGSTYTYEDFMRVFTQGTDSGPVIITVRSQHAPQIWTRTYNQTETGTFGQFIPAVRIDAAAGSGNAFGQGKYYIAGLRQDSRFRTNLGFVNPNAQTINAIVRVFDDEREQLGQFTLQLPPFQLDQFPITAAKAVPNLPTDRPFSIDVEVPQGQWLIAYASYIDSASNDPVFIQAVRESELTLTDYRQGVMPGVGHVGEWRSDVTIYNPDTQKVNVDLTYFDQNGVKVAEAKSVPIGGGEFVQYTDFLKHGILGSVADSLGMLRVTVPESSFSTKFPMTFARTYNDKGTGQTFGQGIGGFAAARTNVKPGKPALVPGIRSNSKYYTNVGLINPSGVTVTATVKRLDPNSGAELVIGQHTLAPNQSIVARVDLVGLETASLKIEVTGGNLWAFCSIVDKGTLDPEYVPATPLVQ